MAILGMHRSGTSMLAGTLQEAGVHLGNVYDDSIKHNRKGLMEPKAILFMQEDLLKANGGDWSSPPADPTWQNLHLAVRDLFIESRVGHPLWGFKDPRTLFTIDGWRSVLPHLEMAGIFRHPLEVAASLQARNGFSMDKGIAIWKAYNERLLSIHATSPFPVIEFHASPERLRGKLSSVLDALRLPQPLAASELGFFEEGIRRHHVTDTKLPTAVDEIYRKLRDIAL